MKWIAGALLLVNLAVGAFFYLAQNLSSNQASAYSPINAEKIVLQSARLSSNQAPGTQRSDVPQASEMICLEWRGLTEGDLERAREAVKTLAEKRVSSVEELPVDKMFWVIFPPLPSEAASEQKLKEFNALKIKDVSIIKAGVWKNGISFGLYAEEDSARRYIQGLEKKGVSGLRMETRAKEGTTYYYLIRSEDAATLRDLDDLRKTLPATTLTRVACKK